MSLSVSVLCVSAGRLHGLNSGTDSRQSRKGDGYGENSLLHARRRFSEGVVPNPTLQKMKFFPLKWCVFWCVLGGINRAFDSQTINSHLNFLGNFQPVSRQPLWNHCREAECFIPDRAPELPQIHRIFVSLTNAF